MKIIGRYPLFWPLFTVTVFAMLLQISIFIPFISPVLHQAANHQAQLPSSLLSAIAFTMFGQIVLWSLFAIIIAWLSKHICRLLQFNQDACFYLSLIFWFIGFLTILLANQYFFPRSLFADFVNAIVSPNTGVWILMFFVSIMVAALGFTVMCIAKHWRDHYGLYTFLLILSFGYFYAYFSQHKTSPEKSQPNIFIIGLDSIRPDFVYTGIELNSLTPNIDQFLAHATSFRDAITPMARTFPAWISILSGQEPIKTGARYDLADKKQLTLPPLLPEILAKKGYHTIYATDETRFSNINQAYGFDQLITPGMGVNDFVIGTFNDFPLSNLVMNSWLGRWLFPYNYANRASFHHYYPQQFNQHLFWSLPNTKKPLFMAVHFCLPHWPYIWAATERDVNPSSSLEDLRRSYRQSINEVDRQFGEFMALLKKRGDLDNALVVVLSDHGEALNYPRSRVTLPSRYEGDLEKSRFANYVKSTGLAKLDRSLGHGTDVMTPAQYQIFLAMAIYSQSSQHMAEYTFPVSLIDIAPTVLQFVGEQDTHSQGISLLSYLTSDKTPAPAKRVLHTETGFSPDNIINKKPSIEKLLDFGLQHYQINPDTGLIELKTETIESILKNKQTATITEDEIIGTYPNQGDPIIVKYNRKTKRWSD